MRRAQGLGSLEEKECTLFRRNRCMWVLGMLHLLTQPRSAYIDVGRHGMDGGSRNAGGQSEGLETPECTND